jgi:hypothetical protein
MKYWKKLLIYSASLIGCLSIGIAVVLACSDEPDPYDYYTSFFNPNIQGQKDYGAFYFTDYRFTYEDEEPISEAAINAREWATYLGKPVKAADVEKIMYHLDSAGKQRVYHFLDQDLPIADSLAGSNFLATLKKPEYASARKYFQFAQQAEVLNASTYSYWEPEPVDTSGLTTAANEALQSADSEIDPFIKLRFYYQAQKFNHYATNFAEARDVYDQYISGAKTSSHVKGWALALKAGEDRRLGDTIQAAFLFSKVFGDFPERRIQAYRNYHYISAPFDEVLKKARTSEEKANLYAIKGFANSEIETADLENVYANAPSSPLVGVLLVREINKLEQYYLTPALRNTNDNFYSAASSSKVVAKAEKRSIGWPFWIGLLTSFIGSATVILAIRKYHIKSAVGIFGCVVLLTGLTLVVWHFAVRSPVGVERENLSKGSFFVAMPDSVKNKYDEHIEKLRTFCTTLSRNADIPDPQIGTLANAYLFFIQDHPDQGLAELQKTDGQKLSDKINDQKQILKLLLSAQRMKQIKAVDEALLLPSMEWLNKKVIAASNPNRDVYPLKPGDYNQFAITQRNFYNHVLAPAYLRQGDTAKAALAMLYSRNGKGVAYSDYMFEQMPDFWYNYLHANHLKQLIDWKAKRPVDKYLSFLSNALKQVDESNLYELLGTIQLREHHYQQALASFRNEKSKQNSKARKEESRSSGDPFMVTINDYGQPDSRGINKLQFAQKMAQLETKLKADPENAKTYFRIATAIYSTSTYSKSWNMISYLWSSYDFARNQMYYYDTDYVKTSLAKNYYLKARELSTEPEFKAMCTFMAGKCAQKENEAPYFMDDYKTYDEREKAFARQLRKNPYFEEMKQYQATAFYRRAVNECSYLSDFINGK